MLQDEIRTLEEQLSTPAIRASADALDRLISDEFVEFGSSGRIYTKQDVIAQLLANPNSQVTLGELQVRSLSPTMSHSPPIGPLRRCAVQSGDVKGNVGEPSSTRARPSPPDEVRVASALRSQPRGEWTRTRWLIRPA